MDESNDPLNRKQRPTVSFKGLADSPSSNPGSSFNPIDVSKKDTTNDEDNTIAIPPKIKTPQSQLPLLHSSSTPHRKRSLRQYIDHVWNGLPRAAKITLILAAVSTVLLIAYGVTTVSLRSYDEEAHIATVIIILAIFILYSTVDAVLYENTLQLISGIILTVLMLARVLWFISTRPENSTLLPLKVIWGALIALVQVSFIIAATMSCRQFGWRLYSKLDVDYRKKGAASMQHLAFVANGFNALVKLDFFFLVTFCALGIDVAVEHRQTADATLLVLSIVSFFVAVAISAFGVVIAISEKWSKKLLFFDAIVPLSFAGPIAIIVLYEISPVDTANAGVSIIIGGCVFMVTRLALWATLHIVVTNSTKMIFIAGRVTVRAGKQHSSDPVLAPLLGGMWLGKPAPRNPKKIRFFQVSHDGSTLRWGWKKFVRLYYAQDVLYNSETLTMTLTFLLDPELTLKFPDSGSFSAWQQGLDHLLIKLMTPEGAALPAGAAGDALESKSGRGKRKAGSASAQLDGEVGEEGPSTVSPPADGEEVRALEEGLLNRLGMRVRNLGSKTFQRRSSSAARISKESEDGIPSPSSPSRRALPSTPSVTTTSHPLQETPPPLAQTTAAPAVSSPPMSPAQLQKRQRMAALLFQVGGSMLRWQGSSNTGGGAGSGRSPMGSWLNRSRSSMAASPGHQRQNSLDPVTDSSLSSSSWNGGRKRLHSEVCLVSIGTQTDDLEFPRPSTAIGDVGGYSSSKGTPIAHAAPGIDHTRTSAASGSDADIAAHYAAIFAAAATASANDGTSASSPSTDKEVRPLKPHPVTIPSNEMTPVAHNLSPTLPSSVSTPPSVPQQANFARGKSSPAQGFHLKNSLPPSPNLTVSVDVIEFEDLQLGKLLGSGSEGAVYAAWYLETPVAVKRFNRVEDSVHEVGMYLGVGSHDNVVALRALCQHDDAMYLVLEYCPRGTLDAMLHYSAPQQWDPTKLLPLVRSIARGMHHLHSRGIVHRDLKPANIFVGHGQTMKVGDFGMARWMMPDGSLPGGNGVGAPSPNAFGENLARLSPGVVGTSQYAAPELVNDDLRPETDNDAEWAMKIDVWSFGVTLWEIMERKRPFDGMSQVGVEALWLNTPYQARLPPFKIPDNLDPSSMRVLRGMSDLVEDCTRLDPLSRPSFGDVLRRLRGLTTMHQK